MTTNVAGTVYDDESKKLTRIKETLINERKVFCLAPSPVTSPVTETPNTISVEDARDCTTVVYNHGSDGHLIKDGKETDESGFFLLSEPGERISAFTKNCGGLIIERK